MEREKVLDSLIELLDESRGGNGVVALLTGGVGSGKTSLLRRFSERAADSGALVLSACGSFAEEDVHLGMLDQLFGNPLLPPETVTQAHRIMASAADADSSSGLRFDARVAHGICVALLELSKERPLVVLVDDMQFADRASLRTLLYIQHRIGVSRVLMILTESASARPARSRLHSEIIRQPHARHLTLPPLSVGGVAQVLAERLGADTAARLAGACHRLTGGNPLLTHALAEDCDQAGATELTAGVAYEHAVLSCLHRSPAHLVRTARAVAVLDGHGGAEDLAQILRMDQAKVTAALNTLEHSGLIEHHRFRHERAARVVRGELPEDEARALNLEVALRLQQQGKPDTVVANYLLRGGTTESWALPVLWGAAQEALRDDRVDDAVAYLTLPKQESMTPREAAAFTARLVQIQHRTNPAAAAMRLGALGESFDQGHLSTPNTADYLYSLLWHGRLDRATAVLAEPSAECFAGSQWVRVWYPGVAGERPASGRYESTCSSQALALSLSSKYREEALAAAEQVLESCWLIEVPQLEEVVAALQALILAGEPHRADRWCDELLKMKAVHTSPTLRAVITDVKAGVALRLGDLNAAERCARQALSILPAQSWGTMVGLPLAHLVDALTRMGRYEEAAAELKRDIPVAVRRTAFWLQYLTARGNHYLATDRLHAALEDFATVRTLAIRWDLDHPELVPWRLSAAKAHARLGHADQARKLLREQLERCGEERVRAYAVCLRALAEVSEFKERLPMLRRAAEQLQTCDDRFELAHVFASLSECAQMLGDYNRARTAQRRAVQLAKSCGAEPLWRSLTPAGAPAVTDAPSPPSDDSSSALSAAEQRVASLASLGHTNREIGRKLYITVSTVEQHLTRVYRKLNINRRTELPSGHRWLSHAGDVDQMPRHEVASW
ncbi:AAA family ATPase [Amycolatopsis sp. OK19-0408]|uniref:AAA family ATPase n=1 Tax=Amycolatopsis iheyensis TaxID=2945988 RepID=A0A9X2N7F0_9PSEU|nr:AAA family ATPase [Amycolatopsis iheyensis]MCR6481895.1 AAA family ATPase [Amycolatopsis iheyensis]